MTGHFSLDWALLAVSLFNVVLLAWLGLTVLFHAAQRTWGVWLAGAGLLGGSAFFVSHAAILGLGPNFLSRGLELWWRLGWLPLAALPLIWYVLILWYAGFWDAPGPSSLRRRQSLWLWTTVALYAGLMGLLLYAGPLPSFASVASLHLSPDAGAGSASSPGLGGLPIALAAFPVYICLCIALSLDALRRPAPSPRLAGDEARTRARPWLLAGGGLLMVVSLAVGGVILWAAANRERYTSAADYATLITAIGQIDLLLSLLIGGVAVLVGQAIVAYELFTGKLLPRGELGRHWLNAVVIAAGFGTVVGLALAGHASPIYVVLLAGLLLAVFYALMVWRSFARREGYVRQLRPLLGSPHLYARLLDAPDQRADDSLELDMAAPFRVLCREVLGVSRAGLLPVGPLAPLIGPPLVYPAAGDAPSAWPVEVAALFTTPQELCRPLDPAQSGGLRWVVPLWSERGLVGLLFLGPKSDAGLFTQEEMEIARASGERLIDNRASGEIARSLMALQRQRLAESHLLDQRTRRVLHDEVLPLIHSALLHLPDDVGQSPEVAGQLRDAHRQIAHLLREMPPAPIRPQAAQGLVDALHRLVEDELAGQFDGVSWRVEPDGADRARSLPPLAAEVLYYAAREVMRNAARYGRGAAAGAPASRPLHLRVSLLDEAGLTLLIEDDGVGIDPGRAAGEEGGGEEGARQGLSLHSTLLAVVGATLEIDSRPGAYTCARIHLALDNPGRQVPADTARL